MEAIDFKEKNLTLRAGDNPHTIPLSVCIASHDHFIGPTFYVSNWQAEEHEIGNYKYRLAQALDKYADVTPKFKAFLAQCNLEEQREFLDVIAKKLPKVYLSTMHVPPPANVYFENPFGDKEEHLPGIMKPLDDLAAEMKKINSNPKDN
jgi:hypothetical protein